MSAVRIRPAAECDLPAILRITNDAILHSTALWSITPVTLQERRDWMAARLAAGYPVLVAERGADVAGFGSFGQFRPHEGYALTVEHSLYVDQAARRGGIGRALLEALISEGRSRGKHVMIGGIEAQNQASIALHVQAGFTQVGVLAQVGRKFDRWLDLVFMHKHLAN